MAKHLLDETAEFKIPTVARHAAADEDALTRRLDGGARRQPPVPDRPQGTDRSE